MQMALVLNLVCNISLLNLEKYFFLLSKFFTLTQSILLLFKDKGVQSKLNSFELGTNFLRNYNLIVAFPLLPVKFILT